MERHSEKSAEVRKLVLSGWDCEWAHRTDVEFADTESMVLHTTLVHSNINLEILNVRRL